MLAARGEELPEDAELDDLFPTRRKARQPNRRPDLPMRVGAMRISQRALEGFPTMPLLRVFRSPPVLLGEIDYDYVDQPPRSGGDQYIAT